jgi:predicted glycoside hydrolase/deacetylase ChbG (UPF0249 family)
MRYLIVNADDLGLSPGVNRGIRRAHQRGIVTSASLMVRRAAAQDAATIAADLPELSLGLHVDLGEWSYRAGEWLRSDRVVSADDPTAVAAEVERQLEAFGRLTGRNPTHLDSHQHAHREEPARSALLDVGRRLGVPVRHFAPEIRYCGDFYGQSRHNEPCHESISAESLIRILESLAHGVTELACHPGEADVPSSDYNVERAIELESLCDPRVIAAVESRQIRLITFGSRIVEDP